MATVQVHETQPAATYRRSPQDELTAEVALGGSLVEGVGGIAAVVLAMVALAGVLSLYLTAIAAIAVGLALVFEALSNAAHYATMVVESGETSRFGRAEAEGGMSVQLICGAVGVVLGVLTLLNIAPMVLLPVTAIVLGAGLVFGSGARSRLSHHFVEGFRGHEFFRLMAREAVLGATVAEVLIGIGGGILGILALVGTLPLVLTQVAMLAFGAAVVLGGAAMSGKMFGWMHY